jgi:60 kDa SS-A/Ro ribonucleoprotein
MLKYRQRSGWSQRDLLRQAHPSIEIPSARALFNFIATGDVKTSRGPGGTERPVGASREDLPQLVEAFLEAQSATDVKVWTRLIAENPLSWEMLPDKAIGQAEVWKTLIRKGMPQTALQRQLPRLTRLGVLDDSEILSIVVAQLQDADKLRKGRVHPLNILVAQLTYASGQSLRGSSTWTPNVKVVDALDAAYYAAYKTLVPAGKKTLIALDLSGSMTWSNCSSLPVTPRVASAAMSLITLATEPNCDVTGFTGGWGRHGQTGGLTQLTLSPRQRLDDAVRYIQQQGAGGTDCSLPARWAREQGRDYETIVIYTDNETWAGPEQANQALRRYRDHVGHTVKQVVVGMTATDFTIADPRDRDSLDVAGFDSAAPNLIADFSRGDL